MSTIIEDSTQQLEDANIRIDILSAMIESGDSEVAGMLGELRATNEHIQHLHKLVVSANDKLALRNSFKEHREPLCELLALVMNWEANQ